MTPNKNGKVIFATHSEKIDQPRQVPPTELAQKIEVPSFLFPPLKFQKKFPPTNMSCLKSWSPPPLQRGGEETMLVLQNFPFCV